MMSSPSELIESAALPATILVPKFACHLSCFHSQVVLATYERIPCWAGHQTYVRGMITMPLQIRTSVYINDSFYWALPKYWS
jgi:hypothetical protein